MSARKRGSRKRFDQDLPQDGLGGPGGELSAGAEGIASPDLQRRAGGPWRHLGWLLFWFACCIYGASGMRPVGDMWIAVASGNYMFDHLDEASMDDPFGFIPLQDPFSFTATTEHDWLNQNWGTQIIIAAIYGAAGLNGLMVFKVVSVLFVYLMITLVARMMEASWPAAWFFGGVSAFMIEPFATIRPELMGFVFLALMLGCIHRSRRSIAWIWSLPVVMVFWANCHGSFLLGCAILGLEFAARWLNPWWLTPDPGNHKRALVHLFGAGIFSALAAGFINPFGLINLTHPFVVTGQKEWQWVNEWIPSYVFAVRSVPLTPFWIMFTVFAVYSAVYVVWRLRQVLLARTRGESFKGPDKLLWSDILISLIAAWGAIKHRRFIPTFAIFAMPVLAMYWATVVRSVSHRYTESATRTNRTPILGAAFGVLMALFTGYDIWVGYFQVSPRPWPTDIANRSCVTSYYDYDAFDFIRHNDLKGRMFNTWEWGGTHLAELPEHKVFIDGRLQSVYPLDLFMRYRYLLNCQADTEYPYVAKVLDLYNIDWMCWRIPSSRHFTRIIESSPLWEVLYMDDKALVAARVDREATRDVVARARRHELWFPGEWQQKLTWATREFSRGDRVNLAAVKRLAQESNRLKRSQQAHRMLLSVYATARQFREGFEFFKNEVSELQKLAEAPPYHAQEMDMMMLESAMRCTAHLYRYQGNTDLFQQWERMANQTSANISRMRDKYRRFIQM